MEKISVVVPIYNVAKHLKKCIDSIVNQTYSNLEIILVNDGSSDGSMHIINKYEDERIKVIEIENSGAASARNIGISVATGKYIAFIDGDDWISHDFIEVMVNRIKINDADLVVCDYSVFNIERETTESICLNMDDTKLYTLDEKSVLINSIGNAPWNKLYKLEIITSNGILFPEGYRHHDLVFTQKYLLLSNTIVYVNKSLNFYLQDRPNNISTSYDNKINHILKMLSLVISFYKERNVYDEYYDELEYLALSNVYLSLRKLPMVHDKIFVSNYIKESSEWLFSNFKDYKKSPFIRELAIKDRIYFSPFTLKLYCRYIAQFRMDS